MSLKNACLAPSKTCDSKRLPCCAIAELNSASPALIRVSKPSIETEHGARDVRDLARGGRVSTENDRRRELGVGARKRRVASSRGKGKIRPPRPWPPATSVARTVSTVDLAHEINQPLAAITNYAQASLNLLQSVNADVSSLADILTKTKQQALRAGQIIHRMRDFIQARPKQYSRIDINKLIQEAVSLCSADIKHSGIKLSFELQAPLPPVFADHIPSRSNRIINLLRNSMEALQNLPLELPRRLSIQSRLSADDAIQQG